MIGTIKREWHVDHNAPNRGRFPMITLCPYYQALVERLAMDRQLHWEADRGKTLTDEERLKEYIPHLHGAGAECALCLIKNVPFNPTIDTYRKAADAGIIESRYDGGDTAWDSGSCSRIKIDDKDETILASMGGIYPTFVAFGYCSIGAIRERFKKHKDDFKPPNSKAERDPNVQIWVPRTKLDSILRLNPDVFNFDSPALRVEQLEKEIYQQRNVLQGLLDRKV